jgi:hypoxia up-regulated 1
VSSHDGVKLIGRFPLFAIQFTDVAGSLSNFSSPEPVINLTFRLDHRGHIAAANAVIVSNATSAVEESSRGVAGALKGLFGKKEKKEEAEAVVDEDEDADEGEKIEVKKEAKKEKVAVKFREKALGLRAMSGEEKRIAMAR